MKIKRNRPVKSFNVGVPNPFQAKAFCLYVVVALGLTLCAYSPLQAAEDTVVLSSSIGEVDTKGTNHTIPHVTRSVTDGELNGLLTIEVTLLTPNFADLQGRIARREVISSAEMSRYQPSASDCQIVENWLHSLGLTKVHRAPNNEALFVAATYRKLQQVLGINFAWVQNKRGQACIAATSAPVVPVNIASMITGINGLQPNSQPQKQSIILPSDFYSSQPPYLPGQIATAYNAAGLYSSHINGSGQTIAIVIDTFPNPSDLQSFWASCGIPQSINNITFVPVGSGSFDPPSGEETLDTEWSSSIAPGAKVRVYAAGDLSNVSLDLCYAQIYDDVLHHPDLHIHELTMSYGGIESIDSSSQLVSENQYFAHLAALGVTIFASSGDSGANPFPSSGVSSLDRAVEDPACTQFVNGVGGTSLVVDETGAYQSETVWNDSYDGSGASGGGVSKFFPRPAWQPSATTDGLGHSINPSMRRVPDLSLPADPNSPAVVILDGQLQVVGGTSWGSPTMAGFCALLNQCRIKTGLAPFQNFAAEIYRAANSLSSPFHDITVGNNSYDGGVGYSAGPGYDLATGLGTPNVGLLAREIANFKTASIATAPLITSGHPPDLGSTTSPYNFVFTATGFPGPRYTLTSGNLPSGLTDGNPLRYSNPDRLFHILGHCE